MKVSYLLLISLLVVGALFVPAVSAEETIVDENLVYIKDTSASGVNVFTGTFNQQWELNTIYIANVERYTDLSYIGAEYPGNMATSLADGENSFTYTFNGYSATGHVYVSRERNMLGDVTKTRLLFFFDNWYVGSSSGTKSIVLSCDLGNGALIPFYNTWSQHKVDVFFGRGPTLGMNNWYVTVASSTPWKNNIEIVKTESPDGYLVTLDRIVDGIPYTSTINITQNGNTIFTNRQHGVIFQNWYSIDEIDGVVISNDYNSVFTFPLVDSDEPGPGDPSITNRTGSVTMTDHNGTSITGFEVTAENFYTGQTYTFSTDTDVAVISLPMDRTTTIRNPQTGVYEETPVGYYKFYGHTPGYRMLNEDGIRISVMPEKYTSYQICDILVTPESGYMTGKHQFQIRSRADNSILQTGTISAKSATTGVWYNETVSDGIATLILAYDTSNSISQYAGNYYVYATSPGYEDSDYGTQIVVMPHTVSEINVVHLTPIGGIPAAGNVTLRIQAFSEYGPGIPNASIFIAGVVGAGSDVWNTYTASSTGYLEVSVPANSTYDIVASAEGYYDSARRIEVFTESPGLIELKLYLSGAPTLEPTTQPTGWPTTQPTTTPTGGIPDEDDGSESFLIQAVRGIGQAFGVGFSTAKLIFGMLLALSIGFATAKHLRGGAAEFGLGLVGGTMLGVLIGLLPVWTVVVLLLIVGLYIGNRYIGGANNG